MPPVKSHVVHSVVHVQAVPSTFKMPAAQTMDDVVVRPPTTATVEVTCAPVGAKDVETGTVEPVPLATWQER